LQKCTCGFRRLSEIGQTRFFVFYSSDLPGGQFSIIAWASCPAAPRKADSDNPSKASGGEILWQIGHSQRNGRNLEVF
jgi:hypothetical protein